AELSLVVAIGGKVEDDGLAVHMSHRVLHRSVDHRVAAATLLVGWSAGISDTGDDEAVANPSDISLVRGQPGDRADRAGGEEEAVAVTRPASRQSLRQKREQRQPRAVVVGERRVANVSRKKGFFLALSSVQILAIGHAARL